jgi:hypothetical protein
MDPAEEDVIELSSDEEEEPAALSEVSSSPVGHIAEEESNLSAAGRSEGVSSLSSEDVRSEATAEKSEAAAEQQQPSRKRKAGSPSSWLRCRSCGQLLDR